MIRVVRSLPDGRCSAAVKCDICDRQALPWAAIDPADLLRDARHLRLTAALSRKWMWSAYAAGGIGTICPSCWAASTVVEPKPKRPWRR